MIGWKGNIFTDISDKKEAVPPHKRKEQWLRWEEFIALSGRESR
jgi:hypothetical protein